jgi:hypothetical protein
MRLQLSDPAYTDRLASFLRSLGQQPLVTGPDHLELDPAEREEARVELEIYLRVWRVLYPDAKVEVSNWSG